MRWRGNRRARRGRLLWLVALGVLAAGTVVALLRLDAGSNDAGPGSLRAQLQTRMVKVLEATPAAAHHHGEAMDSEMAPSDAKMVCAARVYGFDPPDAATVAAVQKVYGYHLCGIVMKKMAWDGAYKLVGPLVMDLTTNPPTIQVAEGSATVSYTDRVRQLLPERYQAEALDLRKGQLSSDDMEQLRKRYAEASGTSA